MNVIVQLCLILASTSVLAAGKKQPHKDKAAARAHQTPAPTPQIPDIPGDDRYPLPNEKMPGDCLREGKAFDRKKKSCRNATKEFCHSHQLAFDGSSCVRPKSKTPKR